MDGTVETGASAAPAPEAAGEATPAARLFTILAGTSLDHADLFGWAETGDTAPALAADPARPGPAETGRLIQAAGYGAQVETPPLPEPVTASALTPAGGDPESDADTAIEPATGAGTGWALSAEVAALSDYRFRGISQTDTDPALQGSLEAAYAFEGGASVFASVWASNVDFFDADVEVDYTLGVSAPIGPGQASAAAVYYTYPGADGALNYDYVEAIAAYSVSAGPAALEVGAAYSPEFFGETGEALYTYVGAEAALPAGVTGFASAGYQAFDDNAAAGLPDYWSWRVGFSRDFGPLTASLAYEDTDLSQAECGPDICESVIVASLSVGF